MVARGKNEAHTHFIHTLGNALRPQIDSHTECLQHIRGATEGGDGAISMLRNFGAGGGSEDARAGRNVDSASIVTACANDVKDVVTRFDTHHA